MERPIVEVDREPIKRLEEKINKLISKCEKQGIPYKKIIGEDW